MANERVYDGFGSLLGGMNGSIYPTLVPEGQAWNLVNVACRGGKPHNRPRFVEATWTFAQKLDTNGTTVLLTAAAVKAAFIGGKIQGASYYAYNGSEWFWASVSGRFYRMTPQDNGGFYIEDFTPDAGNDPNHDVAYFCQANDYLIIQDGYSQAILIRDSHIYRARPLKREIPTGTIMAYGYGRTWVVTGPNSYVASDLIGEETNAAVKFKDNQYLAENANFVLPSNLGRIRGMAFINLQDTSTGQGPLIVFGEFGAESANVSLPRSQWQTSIIQQEALTQIGACGHRSITAINGDLWFRSADGWRSYRQARAEQMGANQVPQSTRVRPYTDIELPEELYFGSAISFQNRLLVTCNPQRNNVACVHSGMLSLDFDVITSGLSGQGIEPAWDGYWSAPHPIAQLILGVFNGRQRAFAFTTETVFASDGSATRINGISEIIDSDGYDVSGHNNDGTPITVPITSTIETRGYLCQPSLGKDGAYTEKRLEFIDVFETNRLGDTELKVFYRGDGNLLYKPIEDVTESAPSPATIGGPGGPLYTARGRSFVPADGATGADSRLDRRFYDIQLKFVFIGQTYIHRVRIAATLVPESKVGGI